MVASELHTVSVCTYPAANAPFDDFVILGAREFDEF